MLLGISGWIMYQGFGDFENFESSLYTILMVSYGDDFGVRIFLLILIKDLLLVLDEHKLIILKDTASMESIHESFSQTYIFFNKLILTTILINIMIAVLSARFDL